MKKLVPNPAYETARYEGAALDKDGKRMSDTISAMAFGRFLPIRWNIVDGKPVEVPSHIVVEAGKATKSELHL